MATRKAIEKPKLQKRQRVANEEEQSEQGGSSYFASMEAKEAAGLQFFSAGCPTMDAALGGGWVLGRCSNVVGDKSAGKTLLAIEGAANFKRKFKDGLVRYGESESAFDRAYAEQMGMPDDTLYNPGGRALETVEQWEKDLREFIAKCKKAKAPGFYILDSLDALEADEDQLEKAITEDGFGGKKPKLIGALFRKHITDMEDANVHLMVISQIRDRIGVTFGETKTRSGGKALDFYASHIVWIATTGSIKQTKNGIERQIGVDVQAYVKKNKVGLPFRKAEYPIYYGYGIDDMTSSIEWLLTLKGGEDILAKLDMSKAGWKQRVNALRNKGGPEAKELREQLRAIVMREWERVETDFLPKSRKYD